MRRSTIAVLAASVATLAAPAAASAADTIYGVTDAGRLIRFSSDAPGAAAANIPITGLGSGERVVGIDVRPSDDNLYAVTSANRAVQVNEVTGQTRPVFGPFAPALAGASFGVDFNPVANALRIVSDAEQNLRVSAANVTTPEANLAYAPGDPGAGTNPSVAAVAYSDNRPGAAATTLFGIDSARDALVRIAPPNAGTLTTIGPLGQDADEPVGFDIAQSGNVGYAAFHTDEGPPFLSRIDLNNGRASEVAQVNGILIPEGAGNLVDIAVIGAMADDNTRPQLSVAFSSTILEQNTNRLEPSVSCDETCTVTVAAQVQGRDAGEGTAQIVGPGRATVRVPLNAAARARIARRGTELISLDIEAVDAAGNRTAQNNRVSRTQTLGARRG
jgi:hypothetical protein